MTDTKQQTAILRQCRVARVVRKRFPVGCRVRGINVQAGAPNGTVRRHVPGSNAQGGVLVVQWDNGTEGRHSAGSLEVVE